MPRPKLNDRSAPEKMQQAFWTLLETKQYDRITVNDIARTSGINRGSFYYHYGNIAELAEDAIAAIYESPEVLDFITWIIHRSEDDIASLRLTRLLDMPQFRSSIQRIALVLGPHGSPALTRQFKDYVIGMWMTVFGIDADVLDVSQQLTVEFIASGITGIFGRISEVAFEGDLDALNRLPIPGIVVQLLASLRETAPADPPKPQSGDAEAA
ncbi:TetR/AcrR family transcriptional regulator [Bifidobacterium simiarum]|uniref:HTH tetR-type domain-containing protein n=1 Tax=Bifidobacterium simiarum TaxID=2045441 RepID=A0A2M9HGC4_9BIFI|nr:TetR/AcrR family transcriptional regulator [Bifidobacterium simiarum]PJM75865.1 hypothetical protein CSQ87_03105 [Bifidobacterium simiarum]